VMDGNVFLKGATPSIRETNALVLAEREVAIRLVTKADGIYLEMTCDPKWQLAPTRRLVTTRRLGRTQVTGQAFERPDGSAIKLTADYFGQRRDKSHPAPGPFEKLKPDNLPLKVW